MRIFVFVNFVKLIFNKSNSLLWSSQKNNLSFLFDIDDIIPHTNLTVKDSLLSIHKSYLKACSGILDKEWLTGISHITGGGIVNNTKRVLGKNQNLTIDWHAWDRPPIFNAIQEIGNVPEDDLRESMNLGIGLILIVKKNNVNDCIDYLESINERYNLIGQVT